ncbi:hypothetical protein [Vibrio phage 2E1]|nr:hypothetical protein [Vibrio phage 2E1]
MITCKEDLINTYIVKGDDALTKAYISACKEYVDVYALQCDRWPEDRHLYFSSKCKHIQSGECDTSKYKEITLKDLKSKPTKFVKVEGSIFDLKEEFERGELYSSDCDGHYTQLKCEKKLYLAAHQDSVHRKVEIDWRDEVNSYFLKTKVLGVDCTIEESIETNFYNDEFISLCHLVASLTEKPE